MKVISCHFVTFTYFSKRLVFEKGPETTDSSGEVQKSKETESTSAFKPQELKTRYETEGSKIVGSATDSVQQLADKETPKEKEAREQREKNRALLQNIFAELENALGNLKELHRTVRGNNKEEIALLAISIKEKLKPVVDKHITDFQEIYKSPSDHMSENIKSFPLDRHEDHFLDLKFDRKTKTPLWEVNVTQYSE